MAASSPSEQLLVDPGNLCAVSCGLRSGNRAGRAGCQAGELDDPSLYPTEPLLPSNLGPLSSLHRLLTVAGLFAAVGGIGEAMAVWQVER